MGPGDLGWASLVQSVLSAFFWCSWRQSSLFIYCWLLLPSYHFSETPFPCLETEEAIFNLFGCSSIHPPTHSSTH